jgi:carbamoyl-phosphate synthase large subunit
VLIAGIGGASLGTEIFKCLELAGVYRVFGCDISELAFGHYQVGFEKTFLVSRTHYTQSVIDLCRREGVEYVIPGAEQPMVMLTEASQSLEDQGIRLIGNSPSVVSLCSDKKATFAYLDQIGVPAPKSVTVDNLHRLTIDDYPCVIKPASNSGGSNSVFLAKDYDEAQIYARYLQNNHLTPLIQQYIPENQGEYTIGVLSLPNGEVVCSIALQRLFHAKLSVSIRSQIGLISSGYSQGLIDDFPDYRFAAERIARSLNSQGPLNVQGRVKNGRFYPFEINPRFSASTYLRALAGINEVHIFLHYLITGRVLPVPLPRTGYYLRSLKEVFVSSDEVVSG